MRKFLNKANVLAVLSGFFTGIAVLYVVFPLAWISMIPLFVVLNREKNNGTVWTGALFGAIASLVTFVPLVSSISTFTGGGLGAGFIVLLIASAVYALLYGLVIFVLKQVLRLVTGSPVYRGLAVASSWTLVEFILNIPIDGMPWFGGHLGNGLSGNYYAIQSAEFLGDHGLTFIMVFVNYMFAVAIVPLQKKQLLVPVLTIAGWMGAGAIIGLRFGQVMEPSQDPFRLAILSENSPPEIKWDDERGNILVKQFFGLNRTAVSMNPDMILWSESAIPWTYEVNDDFVSEIRKVSDPRGITQLLGINTDYDGVQVYNSLYCLSPGREVDRYDKSRALDFIEKPITGIHLPFFTENGTIMVEGENPVPLNTPHGQAGVMICSESFLWKSAFGMVKEGTEYFVHPSNDGWYRKTPIVRQHFYAARLRAVETRKDIAINSNLGISGLIQASGKIAKSRRDTKPFVDIVVVTPNRYMTFYANHPYLWIYLISACLLCSVVFGRKQFKDRIKSKQNSKL